MADLVEGEERLKLQILSTLSICLFDKFQESLFEYIIDILAMKNSSAEIIMHTLSLLYSILTITKTQNLSENILAVVFQDKGGLDVLEDHANSGNQQIAQEATGIMQEFYGYEIEDSLFD